jgi:type II secretion system protein G
MRISETKKGFTLLELLIVITIIGILSSIVLVSLNTSRAKSRDANRAAQMREYTKALELYYADHNQYPDDGSLVNVNFDTLTTQLVDEGHISAIPEDVNGPTVYQYCTPPDRQSVVVAVNTEFDRGGSDYCHMLLGPGPYGCIYKDGVHIDAGDNCSTRF